MNRSLKWIAGVFAAFSFSLVLFAAVPSQEALAADRCQAYAVDETTKVPGGIFGNRMEEVAAAAKSLETVGAEGRAIAIQTFGNAANLDEYIKSMAASCRSWLVDGQLKGNFFALVVSMDERKVTLYYGDTWRSRFDAEYASIQSDTMAPQLRNGDYAQAYIDAFDRIKAIIKAPAAPSGGGGYQQEPTQPAQQQVQIDWSIVWAWIGGIVGVIVLGALVIMVVVPWFSAIRDSKKLRDQAIALRAQYLSELASHKADVDSPDFIPMFEDFGTAGGDILSGAKSDRQKAQDDLVAAEENAARAVKLGDPQRHLSDSTNVEIAKRYRAALQGLGEVRKSLTSIYERHESLMAKANKAASVVEELDTRLTGANTQLLELQQHDLDTASFGLELERVGQQVAAVRGLQDSSAITLIKDLPGLERDVEKCLDAIAKAGESWDLSQELLAELPKAHQAAVDKHVLATEAFERMSATYAPDSWENVKGNGSEADSLLFRAHEMLDKVSSEPPKSVTELQGRVGKLDEIRKMIVRGASLYDAVIVREQDISRAEQTAEQEIADAQADIDKAEAYLKQFDADIDEKGLRLDKALSEARKHLENACAELDKERPNYLVVVKQALLANGAADEVFAKAVDEHEHLESIRRQLASTRELFATSSDKARRYIDKHDSDVSHDAAVTLDLAEKKFAEVGDQPDELSRLETAKKALELANTAYSMASADVAAEEAKREKARRKAREAAAAQAASQESYYSSVRSSYSYSPPPVYHSSPAPSYSPPSISVGGFTHSSGW